MFKTKINLIKDGLFKNEGKNAYHDSVDYNANYHRLWWWWKKKTNPNPLPTSIKDVSVVKGKGEITIHTNGSVDQLITIPYNVSVTEGNYLTSVDINTSLGTSSTYSVGNIDNRLSQKRPKPNQKIRERQERLIRKLSRKGLPLKSLISNNINPTSLEEPTSLDF